MAVTKIVKIIEGDAPGKCTELTYFQIGPADAKRKIFLQAALHADEQPGILILHHLLEYLIDADSKGLLKARFVVFPMVNPLGMGDIGFLQHQGRYDRSSGVNFNRQWPDLYAAIEEHVGAYLTDSAEDNVKRVRELVQHWLSEQQPVNALQQQRHYVMQEAFDADYVLDLHCDSDSLPHIFTVPQSTEVMQNLSDWMGAAATLVCEASGGSSFDEVWSTLWSRLAKQFPNKPIPQATHSATLEYRGQFDTFDELNKTDARHLYAFFQAQGLIGGELILPLPPKTPSATDLAATEMIKTPQAGLLAYTVELGQQVKKGDLIAELISLDGEEAFRKRIPLYAGTAGVVLSRNTFKYVWRGASVAKIVGKELLPSRGKYLLQD
ncbi:succinylglutamate desuccinylase/aspartoacylase family protein [Thiofilum flexile]|uniref:succinylglutamate desuccinylase/aspartoacylase family protein n=1 Tax=Thiofilum flexile TaxID=125627 RepID=UPI0003655360|nr:M14 family metallopeptidase [Thiofilum flexile]